MNIINLLPDRKNYQNLTLGLIFILGLFLRFYNFPKRYGFDFDAARDGLVSSLFSEKLSLPLTGAASSAAPFNFGPWYYYGLIFFEKFIPIYGSWVFISVISLITILIFYKIGEKLENKNFGLILSGIVAVAPSQIILSTTLSNPSVIPLFSGLVILFFVNYLRTKKTFYLFLLSFFLLMGVTIHFQIAGFIIFPVLALVFYKNRIKNIIAVFAGLVIPTVPILIYEVNNNFYNLRGLFFFITSSRGNVYVANRWLFYVRDFWPGFWSETVGLNPQLAILIMLSFGCLCLFLGYKRKINKSQLLLFIAFIFNFFLLRYYPAQKPIYYLYFLQSFIFVFTGFLFFKIMEYKILKPIGFLSIIIFLFIILNRDLVIIKSESSNREVVGIAGDLIRKFPDNKFNVYACNSNFDRGMGLVYILDRKKLVSLEGRKISLDSMDCVGGDEYKSITVLKPEELKNMQVHRSY